MEDRTWKKTFIKILKIQMLWKVFLNV